MASARYWRAVALQTQSSTLELSDIVLTNGGSDVAATLTCSHIPIAGSLADLNDGLTSASCTFAAGAHSAGGFAFKFDAGGTVDADALRIGSGASDGGFPSAVDLEYLDGTGRWALASQLRFSWAGAFAWCDALLSAAPFYRLLVTSNNGDAYLSIQEVELSATGMVVTFPSMTTGQSSYYTGPGLVANASHLVDGDVTDPVLSDWTTATGASFPHWATFELATGAAVNTMRVWAKNQWVGPARAPKDFKLQASTDGGATWGDVIVVTGQTGWSAGEVRTFTRSGSGAAPLSPRTVRAGGKVAFSSPVPAASVRWQGASLLARDMEFGGAGTIAGQTLLKDGGPEVPTRARVLLLRKRDSLLARETWSDPATGAYSFTDLDPAQQFIALAQKPDGAYEPVAGGPLTPQVP